MPDYPDRTPLPARLDRGYKLTRADFQELMDDRDAHAEAVGDVVAQVNGSGGAVAIANVTGLTAALALLQDKATATTDTELAAAVATLTGALAGKQDAASAATDAEVASAVSTINASLASKQDASLAATDAELAAAVATINATISGLSAGFPTVQDEGTSLTVRPTINFTGAGVTVTDAGGKTNVAIPGGGSAAPDATTTVKGLTTVGATGGAATFDALATEVTNRTTGDTNAVSTAAADATSKANAAQAAAIQRANHTGTQAPSTITGTAAVTADLTANAAADRARANHTGSQTSATISDFTEAVQDAVAALLGAGSNVTLNYDDAGNTLTVTSTGGGTTDLEAVRDAMGIALVGTGAISIAVNDAADTITISTTATANATDAALRDRSTHTGTQAPATITGTAVVTADSRLSDARTPTAHKTSHATGGSDALVPSDIGAVAASTATTKGDLLAATGSAAVARLGVGTDGQVLTAASGQSTGLQWATPSAGGGGSGMPALVAAMTSAGALVTNKSTPLDASGGGGSFVATLPASPTAGDVVDFFKYDTSSNQITVTGNVMGSTQSLVLRVRGDGGMYMWSGATWMELARHRVPAVDGLAGNRLVDGTTVFIGDSVVKQGGPASWSGVRSTGIFGAFTQVSWPAMAVLYSKGRIIMDGTHGVSGAQAASIVGTQLEEVLAQPYAMRPKTIIFGSPTNNCAAGSTGTASLASGLLYYAQAYRRCRELGIRVAQVGPMPRSGSAAPDGVVDVQGPREMDAALNALCRKEGILYIPVYHLLANPDGTFITGVSSDGLHPDIGSGCAIIGKAVGDAVIKEGWSVYQLPVAQSRAVMLTPTGTTSSGSPTVSALSSMTGLASGQPIQGVGIPDGTYIGTVTTGTSSLTLVNGPGSTTPVNAIASGTTVALSVWPDGVLASNPTMQGGTSSTAPTGMSGGFGTVVGNTACATVIDAPPAAGFKIQTTGAAAKNGPTMPKPIVGHHVIAGGRFDATIGAASGNAKLTFKSTGGTADTYGSITLTGTTGFPAGGFGTPAIPDGCVWLCRWMVPTTSTATAMQISVGSQGAGDIAGLGQLASQDLEASLAFV